MTRDKWLPTIIRPPGQVGTQLADFDIDCMDGSVFSMSANLGKTVVIAYIRPSYCEATIKEDKCRVVAQLKELSNVKNAVILVVSKCDWHDYGHVQKDHPAIYEEIPPGSGNWVLVDFPSKDECRNWQKPYVQSLNPTVLVAIDIPPAYNDWNEYWRQYGSPDYPMQKVGGMVQNIAFLHMIPTTVVIDKEGVVRYRNAGFTLGSKIQGQVDVK